VYISTSFAATEYLKQALQDMLGVTGSPVNTSTLFAAAEHQKQANECVLKGEAKRVSKQIREKIQDLPLPAVLLIQDPPLVDMLYLAVYPSSSVVVTNKTPGGTKYSTAETLGRGADDKLFSM